MKKGIVLKALILITLAIILGAFGAHYLESVLKTKQLSAFRTGVNYQLYGGLVLLIFGLNFKSLKFQARFPINLFFGGVCLFSFSLYFVSLFHQSPLIHYLWPITPIGGLLMIISLFIFVYKIWKSKN